MTKEELRALMSTSEDNPFDERAADKIFFYEYLRNKRVYK